MSINIYLDKFSFSSHATRVKSTSSLSRTCTLLHYLLFYIMSLSLSPLSFLPPLIPCPCPLTPCPYSCPYPLPVPIPVPLPVPVSLFVLIPLSPVLLLSLSVYLFVVVFHVCITFKFHFFLLTFYITSSLSRTCTTKTGVIFYDKIKNKLIVSKQRTVFKENNF